MSASEPRTLRELRCAGALARVLTAGRVVLAGTRSFRLEQDGVRVEAEAAQVPPLFAWVTVEGAWTGSRLVCRRVDIAAVPHREPSHADSDVAWGTGGGAALLRARHTALRAIHSFFDAEGFIEVETPTVVRSPGLELHLEALEVRGLPGPRFLHTSPEYHMKRLLAAGMSRIYQLCKAYRRDESGPLHQPEFTMLEWYRSFADSEQLMRDTEALVSHAARALHGDTRVSGPSGELDLTPPWERLRVRDAFARYASRPMDELLPDEDAFFRALVEEVEPQLGRGKPTFLTHYPASMAALARRHPDDPSCAERFEAYAHGIELCNGFGELTDPIEQRLRFEADVAARAARGRAAYPIDERFLDALEAGLPPSGGNALGVDRLLMLLLGKREISEVLAFSFERA